MNKWRFLFLLFLLIGLNVNSSQTIWKPFKERVEIAEIIFLGEVIDVYSQTEPEIENKMAQYKDGKVIKEQVLPPQIFTTFVIKIKEVLKGDYQDATIEIKVLGGCDEEQQNCVSYSFGYDYKIGDKALMFVTLHNNYYRRSPYSHPYKLVGSHELITLYSGQIEYLTVKDENNNITIKDVLTLALLRKLIQ